MAFSLGFTGAWTRAAANRLALGMAMSLLVATALGAVGTASR